MCVSVFVNVCVFKSVCVCVCVCVVVEITQIKLQGHCFEFVF